MLYNSLLETGGLEGSGDAPRRPGDAPKGDAPRDAGDTPVIPANCDDARDDGGGGGDREQDRGAARTPVLCGDASGTPVDAS